MGEGEQRKNLIHFGDAALVENLADERPRVVADSMTSMAYFAEDNFAEDR